jgi:oxygen-dependent protoporphyrinogen oxidase
MKRVAIIGGGLAGLSAAFDLARAGVEFELFEASDRLGGLVRSSTRDGFLIEHGADSWIANKPWLEELAGDLGMAGEVIASATVSPSTWILRNGELVPLPAGLSLFVPSDLRAIGESRLFSEETKRRFHRELAHPPAPLAEGQDESIAEFGERHFGREAVEVLAAPLLVGVYGGDAGKLSARAVMPGMVALEAQYGSLIRGVQQERSSGVQRPSVFRTFRCGMESLVQRLATRLAPGSLRVGAPVKRLMREGESYAIHLQRDVRAGFTDVILALPVPAAAHVLGTKLSKVEYSSAATVALGYDFVPNLPPGFGFLVATGEPCEIMAATFVQQKWPERIPKGKSMIRVFVADPKLLNAGMKTDGVLLEAAQRALARILGINRDPLFAVVDRWPNSMPQYEVGHLERIQQMRESVARLSSGKVTLAGNSYAGVGMPDTVRSGREAARSVLQKA